MALAAAISIVLGFETEARILAALAAGPAVLLPIIVRLVLFARTGIYDRMWEYGSTPDFTRLTGATLAASAVAVVLASLALAPGFLGATVEIPFSYWVLEGLLSLATVSGLRLAIRMAHDLHITRRHAARASRPAATLLFGAGEAGVEMARSALREPRAGIRPVGFLDDNPDLRGQWIAGQRVFGTLADLDRAIAATRAQQLLITMPAAAGEAIRRVTKAASEAGLAVRIVPPLHELLNGSVDAYRVRHVQLEDLLRRAPSTDRLPSVRPMIEGKRVLITGGGGSIGSELARQVWSLKPGYLALVDRAESALYEIQRELLDGGAPTEPRLSVHLTNVASRQAIERLIGQVRPDVIFHAAAYKHVPLMESHPSDAIQVNVGGTLAVMEAAVAHDVQRFVLVSSDKAVHPSSVMGATKRVGEWLVAEAAGRTGRSYVSVRFGNVLGSNGSVVPIFQGQLERGEPITITHPAMKRYFMTIPEAVWLILDAAALGSEGETFVLEMGEQIAIIDLARDLARLAGKDPDVVPIHVTGLRPGEKLTEVLVEDTEVVRPTSSGKVKQVIPRPAPPNLGERVRELLLLASGEHDDAVRQGLFDLVEGRDSDSARTAAGTGADPVSDTAASQDALPSTTPAGALLVHGDPIVRGSSTMLE